MLGLTNTLTTSQFAGTVGAYAHPFGDFFNTVYTIVPPHFDGGLHNSPAAQFVLFSSGIANISLPTSDDYAVVYGGREVIILALDPVGSGHYTMFPGDAETVAFQAPSKMVLCQHMRLFMKVPVEVKAFKT